MLRLLLTALLTIVLLNKEPSKTHTFVSKYNYEISHKKMG